MLQSHAHFPTGEPPRERALARHSVASRVVRRCYRTAAARVRKSGSARRKPRAAREGARSRTSLLQRRWCERGHTSRLCGGAVRASDLPGHRQTVRRRFASSTCPCVTPYSKVVTMRVCGHAASLDFCSMGRNAPGIAPFRRDTLERAELAIRCVTPSQELPASAFVTFPGRDVATDRLHREAAPIL